MYTYIHMYTHEHAHAWEEREANPQKTSLKCKKRVWNV